LAAYYDFQPDPNNSKQLVNRAPSGAALNGEIQGARWVGGRFAEKYALDFKSPGAGVRLNLPAEYRQLTLIAWVNVNDLPNALNALLTSDGWERSGIFHWQIDRDGHIHFSSSIPQLEVLSVGKITPDYFHRWCQLAATVDTAAKRVCFYIDGKSAGNWDSVHMESLKLGSAMIGNWDTRNIEIKTAVRTLDGSIDELMLFDNVLPFEEIQKIYEAGKP
jgi:hypothetical protein